MMAGASRTITASKMTNGSTYACTGISSALDTSLHLNTHILGALLGALGGDICVRHVEVVWWWGMDEVREEGTRA
jgi:hypothetical protein